jgi:hypothetical protein
VKGKLAAIEPWNEADLPSFGGETGSEIASFQKVATLGIKSVAPTTLVNLAPLAYANRGHLVELAANELEPYFDSYSVHVYDDVTRYPEILSLHKQVSALEPIWITECAQPFKAEGELSSEGSRLQAESVPKVISSGLAGGASEVFHFILPYFQENNSMWGLFAKNGTPRPSFCALAAAGRFLAGAKYVGQVKSVRRNRVSI